MVSVLLAVGSALAVEAGLRGAGVGAQVSEQVAAGRLVSPPNIRASTKPEAAMRIAAATAEITRSAARVRGRNAAARGWRMAVSGGALASADVGLVVLTSPLT
jgi:hypothetical protein